ncbi:hypothetical protein C0J52_24998 [Blattella germanica]|nr:hypothetical protein C0J52_24998 [Blattella germanica]
MAFLRAAIRSNVYRKFGISGLQLTQKGSNSFILKFSIPPASFGPFTLKSTHAASAIGYDTAVEGKSSQQHPRDPLDLTFEDHVAAFKSKTTWEVLRAYIVYTLCTSEFLVENNMMAMITHVIYIPIGFDTVDRLVRLQ